MTNLLGCPKCLGRDHLERGLLYMLSKDLTMICFGEVKCLMCLTLDNLFDFPILNLHHLPIVDILILTDGAQPWSEHPGLPRLTRLRARARETLNCNWLGKSPGKMEGS